jgi:[ribosomal protein S18]-alanine N-acetyltransferase
MSLQAVPMRETDLNDVLAIESVSFSAPWSRNMFMEEMYNRNAYLTAFKSSGRLVGYLCFWAVLDEAHVLNVAVHPELRRQGIGKTIMEYLESKSKEIGIKRIILEVGRRNISARNLYKQCGFNSIGFRKRYYTINEDDALVMEKWLVASETTYPMQS